MDWKNYWNERAQGGKTPHDQVGRVGGRARINGEVLKEITAGIRLHLQLKPSDHVLDICCGNGMLTRMLADHCAVVTGVDISPKQISLAKQHNADPDINYLVGDAACIHEAVSASFDKINLYFSFQYLDTFAKGKAAIFGMARLLKPGGCIFIGDVPDAEKLSVYYPSWFKQFKYRLKLILGISSMGKFWHVKEMDAIARSCGLQVNQIKQPSHLPYAHYRVDYILRSQTAI